ncbi:hypothetical protein HR060_10220 [Catenovulum sp. SM1970]|uniref:hypothetical protein n=1 Tax=Marinifaba aquimaris TaxID=2741323 RepID=UPI0015728372|nr:hypothetical protein [Marinifaba aquimaris]NTS77238.1 hypothetical protein [Marinifaba aquimaris]
MRALLMVGDNQYGVLSQFATGMEKDLTSLGVAVELVVISKENDLSKQFSPLLEYDFIVSFNAVASDIAAPGYSVAEYAKQKPFYIYTVDHPIHLMRRFIGLNIIVLCVDQEHVGFCRLCGIKAEFFPHAVSAKSVSAQNAIPYQEKSDEIIFPVSFFDPTSWREKLNPVWNQIGPLVERAQNITDFMQLLGVLPRGNRPASLQLDENIRRVCFTVDFYLRAKQRIQTLSYFEEQGTSLTVVGRNSEQYQDIAPSHQYLPAMEFTDLQQRIKQAKLVIHNSPGFAKGLHERVVEPYAMGTLISGINLDYLAQECDDFFIQPEAIHALSAEQYNQQQASAIAWIQSQHTWLKRWQKAIPELVQ